MAPVFVANLQGNPRMLQVGLEVRVHDPATGEFLARHDPALRHGILDLLSVQEGQALKAREGKEDLRTAIKDRINGLIEQYKGPGKVDDVLFSSFVMQ
jgi:flagellar FliL protein